MSNDLIALVVALGLGVVVVVIGMRRNLSETTRSNLPRFSLNLLLGVRTSRRPSGVADRSG